MIPMLIITLWKYIKLVLSFIFIKIPTKIFDILKSILNFLKWLFIPKKEKSKVISTNKAKKPVKRTTTQKRK